MEYQKGIVYTILSSATFAMTPLLVVNAYASGASAWEMIFVQTSVASFILLSGLFLLAPKTLRLTKAEFKILAPIGLIGSLGTVVCYNLSLMYISGGIATLLLYTYPAIVALGTVFIFGQKVSRKQSIALVLGFLGVAFASKILKLGGVNINSKGLILGVLAAFSYAVLNLLSEKALENLSPWKVTAFSQFGATTGVLIINLVFPNLIAIKAISPLTWMYGGAVAIVCSIIPFFFLMRGIFYIGSGRASIISTAEIPLTLLLVFLFLGETFSTLQILGSMLIFLSILILKKEGEKIGSLA